MRACVHARERARERFWCRQRPYPLLPGPSTHPLPIRCAALPTTPLRPQVLRRGDVLTHLDGVAIADDGTFLFRVAVRIDFRHIASCAFDGDAVTVREIGAGVGLWPKPWQRQQLAYDEVVGSRLCAAVVLCVRPALRLLHALHLDHMPFQWTKSHAQ